MKLNPLRVSTLHGPAWKPFSPASPQEEEENDGDRTDGRVQSCTFAVVRVQKCDHCCVSQPQACFRADPQIISHTNYTYAHRYFPPLNAVTLDLHKILLFYHLFIHLFVGTRATRILLSNKSTSLGCWSFFVFLFLKQLQSLNKRLAMTRYHRRQVTYFYRIINAQWHLKAHRLALVGNLAGERTFLIH